MERHGIPTARSGTFAEVKAAGEFVEQSELPLVVKADGLALGKGVIIAQTRQEALAAVHEMMEEGKFGEAGRQVVIEEYLEGVECSIHALVDGRDYLLFPAAKDHKRAFDGDLGPNTGGMGTISPVPALTPELEARVRSEVMERFMAGLRADGIDFRGMLFPGLMLTKEGPKVLEFNCRFGDPETQVLLSRLESDLLELLEATVRGELKSAQPQWKSDAAVCVVMASGGYPGSYKSGQGDRGLDRRRGRRRALLSRGHAAAGGAARHQRRARAGRDRVRCRSGVSASEGLSRGGEGALQRRAIPPRHRRDIERFQSTVARPLPKACSEVDRLVPETMG